MEHAAPSHSSIDVDRRAWIGRDVQDLESAVALVTGGGGGLGEAIARTLCDAGAIVVAADRDMARAEHVANALRDAGKQCSPLHLDVTDEASVDAAVDGTIERYGRLDVLVNNAGVDVTLPVEELQVADWDTVLAVNLRGPFLLSRRVLPLMRDRRSGHIVNIVSTAAKRAWANASVYHASKWGLLGLSHALHVEARPHGVKVTAVIAGGMRTPFLLDRFPDIDPDVLQDPANVAETVRFVLMQPEGSVVPEVMVLPMRETSWP